MSQVKVINVHESKTVTGGAILTFNIPSYATIDDIMLNFTNSGAAATNAAIKAAIGKVALNINGEQVINTTITRLFDLFDFLGTEVNQYATKPNVISLNISRLFFKNPQYEKAFAIGCANVQTIQLQVYCNATVTGVTDVEVSTSRRNFVSNTISFCKVISYPQTMASTGISTVDTLPRDSNDGYLAVLANNGGGAIASGECVLNGNTIIDPISANLSNYIASARGYAPVSGYFPYLFTDGSASGVIPMKGVTELRFKTNFSTAPTAGVYDLVAITIKNLPDMFYQAATA